MRSLSNAATTPINLMAEADKIYGKFLPETIDPPERVCFVIEIPDTLQYRAALMGQLEWLADWRCWEHTEEDYYNPPARNIEAAQLFAIAVTDGRFDECGVMSCDDVQDCIETDAGVQSAISGLTESQNTNGNEYPYGQSLTPGAMSHNMAGESNPTCDLAILWSQCIGLVDYTKSAISVALGKVEASTNPVELVNALIDVIPLVGTVKQTIGVSGVLDTINYFQEAIGEGFNAQWDETPGGIRDQIACDVFCYCKSDCVVNVERVLDVMANRLSVYIAPPTITGFSNLISTIGGFNVDTTFVVDATFWVAWQLVKQGNFLFGGRFDNILDVVLELKADEPSNDYLTLCAECPSQFTLQKFNVYSGGTPFSTQELNYNTIEIESYASADNPDYQMVRIEFAGEVVNIDQVGATGVQVVGAINPLETWTDWVDESNVYTFWNANGYGNNATLPYVDFANYPDGNYKRLYAQNSVPFSVILTFAAP